MTAACVAVALAVGGWAGIRWAEAAHMIDRGIAEIIFLSSDIDTAAANAEDDL